MSKPRLKIVVASTYPFDPPLHGGQKRASALYSEIAGFADVEVIAISSETTASRRSTDFGFIQTTIPCSREHQLADGQLGQKVGFSAADIAFSDLVAKTPAFADALQRSLAEADIAFCCQPYVYPSIRSVWSGPIVYDSQNVETLLKQIILPQTAVGAQLLEHTCALEKECLRGSDLVSTMSSEDATLFSSAFGISLDKILTVPPGLSAEPFLFRTATQRTSARRTAQVASPVAIFVGSDHPPNYSAVRAIYEAARKLPGVTFVVAGGASRELASVSLPKNLVALGIIPDAELERIFSLADLALNPCTTLSGINMKMYDYVLRGLPVIAHPNGARGTGLQNRRHLLLVQNDELSDAISASISDPMVAESRAVAAYGHLLSQSNSKSIMMTLERRLRGLLQPVARV